MIRPSDSGPLVYLCVEPVDGRKQINGLAQLVQDTLELNPFSEQLYVFSNRRRDRCKILYWGVPRTFVLGRAVLWRR